MSSLLTLNPLQAGLLVSPAFSVGTPNHEAVANLVGFLPRPTISAHKAPLWQLSNPHSTQLPLPGLVQGRT